MISSKAKPQEIIFIDVETAPKYPSAESFEKAEPKLWQLWLKKERDFTDCALFAEFGRVVCISVGALDKSGKFKRVSFTGDELTVLNQWAQMMGKLGNNIKYIGGHNLKEFDIPFLIKRLTLKGMQLPKFLQIHGLKPWEMDFVIDTMEIWRCGSFRGNVSLQVLTLCFGLVDPKENTDGGMVWELARDGKYQEIAKYCEGDVLATAQVFCKMHGFDIIKA